MKHLKKFESYRNDTDDKLYRLLSKYYRDFLNSRLDDVDPDRSGVNLDFKNDFINDCIEMYGSEGDDEFNSGYDDDDIRRVAEKICEEE
jgi:hypothetical protein